MMEEKFGKEDIIESIPDKSLQEIAKEVQEEENLTPEQLADTMQSLLDLGFKIHPKYLKQNKKKNMVKAKRKQVKKSRRQNR